MWSSAMFIGGKRTVVAVKIETDDAGHLENEVRVLHDLAAASGSDLFTPMVHWNGKYSFNKLEHNAFAMDLCGPSLNTLRKEKCAGKLSMKDTLMVGDQLLAAFEHIHDLGFLQVTVKDANVAVRAGAPEQLMLVDFGRGRTYLDDEGVHIKETRDYVIKDGEGGRKILHYTDGLGSDKFVGTCFSVNGWHGNVLSRRDDLESVGYTLFRVMRGLLPWESDEGRERVLTQDDYDRAHSDCLAKAKYADCPSWIWPQAPSPVFADFVAYARALKFDERPDYAHWRGRFKRAFSRLGYAGWRLRQGVDANEIANNPTAILADSPFEPSPAGDVWSFGPFQWM